MNTKDLKMQSVPRFDQERFQIWDTISANRLGAFANDDEATEFIAFLFEDQGQLALEGLNVDDSSTNCYAIDADKWLRGERPNEPITPVITKTIR